MVHIDVPTSEVPDARGAVSVNKAAQIASSRGEDISIQNRDDSQYSGCQDHSDHSLVLSDANIPKHDSRKNHPSVLATQHSAGVFASVPGASMGSDSPPSNTTCRQIQP